MKKKLNKVIIVGTDHHNVLGTVRCFGVNKIKPYGIIVKNDDSPLWVTKSRYWEKTWVIDSDEKISEVLIDIFSEEEYKPVIICCSDGAMSHIDNNINQLSQYFILPSFNNEQGAITRLMNKETQSEYFVESGLKPINTVIITISENPTKDSFKYPIILKPVASVEGDKKDITICYNDNDMKNALLRLSNKDYKRILVQPFISEKTEYTITGAVTDNHLSYSVCEKLRQWPLQIGSGSFVRLSIENRITEFAENMLFELKKSGYRGPVDIDVFQSNSDLYINEINWRVGGWNFVNLYNKTFSTLLYYCDVTQNSYKGIVVNKKRGYCMIESMDMRNAFSTGFLSWVKELLITRSFALFLWRDLKPTLARYKYYIKKLANKENSD